MNGLTQIRDKYTKILSELPETRKREALVISQDVTALVVNRLLNKGEAADGSKFKDYSKNPLPIYYFDESKTNAPSKAIKFKKDAAKKKVVPSYTNFRKALGLPTDKRTFSVTGDMLASVRPVITEHTQLITVVEIKSPDSENNDKLRWNAGIVDKKLLETSKDEIELIEDANIERIGRLFS